jgi:Fe-Mn family superoxide dismutase
MFLREFA